MQINIGIESKARKDISLGLAGLLADTFTLYVKTHAFHWNVRGPFFDPLHKLFGDQYEELHEATDELAERIRALGSQAPGTQAEFLKLTRIKEETGAPDWKLMVKQLIDDHQATILNCREIIPIAEKGGGQGTVDLIVKRLQVHEKDAWMLRSILEE